MLADWFAIVEPGMLISVVTTISEMIMQVRVHQKPLFFWHGRFKIVFALKATGRDKTGCHIEHFNEVDVEYEKSWQ